MKRASTKEPAEAGAGRTPMVPFYREGPKAIPLEVYHRDGTLVVHSPRMHGHRFFVLFYADGGEGVISFAREQVPVSTGHMHLLAPGELHDTRGISAVSGWAAEFTDEIFDEEKGGLSLALPRSGRAHWAGFTRRALEGPAHALVPEADRRRWSLRFELLHHEVREARFGYREAARAILQLLLIDAARLIEPAESTEHISPLVREVFDVIDARYAEPLSLRHVARAVGRSASHLTAVVRVQTGMTVLEWIAERRMADARRRLRETDEDIAIIAERVGYRDATYFIRQFRRAHRMTPRAWRLAHR